MSNRDDRLVLIKVIKVYKNDVSKLRGDKLRVSVLMKYNRQLKGLNKQLKIENYRLKRKLKYRADYIRDNYEVPDELLINNQ